jgi:uncharacterized membrane protein
MTYVHGGFKMRKIEKILIITIAIYFLVKGYTLALAGLIIFELLFTSIFNKARFKKNRN